MHEVNTMSSVYYYCDMLDLNTGVWWCCDYNNTTIFIGISENFYSETTYPTSGKKIKKCNERFRKDHSNVVYLKIDVLLSNSYSFFVG